MACHCILIAAITYTGPGAAGQGESPAGAPTRQRPEPNPNAGDDKNAPPQKLALAFSTADVVVPGWRLGFLADKLQENDLAAVRALAKRYADVDRHMPFVASITITPIAKG